MKTIVILATSAVIAGSVIIFLLFGGNSSTSDQVNTVETSSVDTSDESTQTEPEVMRGEGTLEAVKLLGANLECKITYESEELSEPVAGTYFVSNDKVRGDFEMNVPELGGSFVSSIILDGDMFYSWSKIDGEAYGVKVDQSTMGDTADESLSEPIPGDSAVAYECVKWDSVDGSIFIPPSEVLFRDVNEVLNAGMEYGTVYEEGEF